MSKPVGSLGQVNRLLALVPYLQRRGEVPVAEAALHFGVPVGTIKRDIQVLIYCGLPGLGMGDLIDIDFDAFAEGTGVIRLSNADYLARPLRLDSTEAAALVVGLRALLEGSDGDQREVVARTLAKVEAAAGEAARLAAQVDLVPTVTAPEGLREQLEGAVRTRRQVRLTHRSETRDALTTRVVDPVAVADSGGHTYLDAWCHLVEDRRLFRLDRVAAAELLETPTSTHALRPLDLRRGIFQPSGGDVLVTLRLGDRARWVAEYHPVETTEETPQGLVVTLRVADPGWLVRLVLRLGGTAELVDPAPLAQQVRRTAQAALAAYDAG